MAECSSVPERASKRVRKLLWLIPGKRSWLRKRVRNSACGNPTRMYWQASARPTIRQWEPTSWEDYSATFINEIDESQNTEKCNVKNTNYRRNGFSGCKHSPCFRCRWKSTPFNFPCNGALATRQWAIITAFWLILLLAESKTLKIGLATIIYL